MIGYRHADPRFPFAWGGAGQPADRWRGPDDPPAQAFAESPDGAWAEFLRHEEITDPADVATIARSIWAVELPDEARPKLDLPRATLTGGLATYEACQAEARRVRDGGGTGLIAPSAALRRTSPSGFGTAGRLDPAPIRRERVVVLLDRRPDLVAWAACDTGRPRPDLLARVRQLTP